MVSIKRYTRYNLVAKPVDVSYSSGGPWSKVRIVVDQSRGLIRVQVKQKEQDV